VSTVSSDTGLRPGAGPAPAGEPAGERPVLRPLSIGQQSLWTQYRLAPGSAAYNDADAVIFTPQPEVADLRTALLAVADRHELLRSRFVEVDGQPVRQPFPAREVRLQVRQLPPGADLHETVRALARTPLRLEDDGPLRVVLVRDGWRAALVLCVHHIASDAISQRLLWRDLSLAYEAALRGTEPEFPPLGATYDDYVRQEERLLDTRGPELARHWRAVAAGAVAAELPPDRPRPPHPAFSGASCSREFPDGLSEQVRVAAQGAGVTPFSLLLGAFQALLYRHTGQADLSIGCPTSVRRRRALREVVGLLVNVQLLRARFGPATTLAEAVASAAEQVQSGAGRAGYPFALIGSGSRAPLVRILITMVSPQTGDDLPLGAGYVDLADHRIEVLELPRLEGQVDLNVSIHRTPAGFSVAFRYDTELFDAATVERLLDHYLRMVAAACVRPQDPVSEVPLAH
jgi:hypothetical protein